MVMITGPIVSLDVGEFMTNEKKPRVVDYLHLKAQKLRLDLQAARLFIGTTDIGNIAEHEFRKILTDILPTRYAVGVGEIITPQDQSLRNQSQQKDVIIYDPVSSAIFDWGDGEISLFPAESVYAVMEVKTSLADSDDFRKAMRQAREGQVLCQTRGNSPFTAVFAFESRIAADTMFKILKELPKHERVDFVLVLEPKPSGESFYLSHWNYEEANKGRITMLPAHVAAEAPASDQLLGKLTLGRSPDAILWFYLFLLDELSKKQLSSPDMWQYTDSSKLNLGHLANE
jgi:hypothetical protein